MMKTIVLIIEQGFGARILLQTELLGTLLNSGFRLVVLTSDAETAKRYLSARGLSQVGVEQLDTTRSEPPRIRFSGTMSRSGTVEKSRLFTLHPIPVCLIFIPFRTRSCHTYSLTTSGPALPVADYPAPEKPVFIRFSSRYPLASKKQTHILKNSDPRTRVASSMSDTSSHRRTRKRYGPLSARKANNSLVNAVNLGSIANLSYISSP